MIRSLVLIGVLAGFGLAGCGDKPSKKDCEQLLTHMYDMDVKESGATKVTDSQKKSVDKQIKEVKKELRKSFMKQCMDRTPKKWIKCALKAKNKEEISRCEG